MLKQAKQLQPKLFDQVYNLFYSAIHDSYSIKLALKAYLRIKDISIDYAIIEYIPKMIMLEGNFQWSDLGNWQSLWQVSKKDVNHNHCLGNIIVNDTTNSYIHSYNNKLITTIGLDNMIIINTKNTLLIANKLKVNNIKHIVATIKHSKRKLRIKTILNSVYKL